MSWRTRQLGTAVGLREAADQDAGDETAPGVPDGGGGTANASHVAPTLAAKAVDYSVSMHGQWEGPGSFQEKEESFASKKEASPYSNPWEMAETCGRCLPPPSDLTEEFSLFPRPPPARPRWSPPGRVAAAQGRRLQATVAPAAGGGSGATPTVAPPPPPTKAQCIGEVETVAIRVFHKCVTDKAIFFNVFESWDFDVHYEELCKCWTELKVDVKNCLQTYTFQDEYKFLEGTIESVCQDCAAHQAARSVWAWADVDLCLKQSKPEERCNCIFKFDRLFMPGCGTHVWGRLVNQYVDDLRTASCQKGAEEPEAVGGAVWTRGGDGTLGVVGFVVLLALGGRRAADGLL